MAEQQSRSLREIKGILDDPESSAKRRAIRETGIVVGMSLIPILLGTLFAYASDRLSEDSYENYWFYIEKGTLGGQLFLAFLSLAGTNFSRLWDPEAPKVTFSGVANVFNVGGALLATGLLGLDDTLSKFHFFPINLMSLAFMLGAIFHYFCLSVLSYVDKPDATEAPRERGRAMAGALEEASKKPVATTPKSAGLAMAEALEATSTQP